MIVKETARYLQDLAAELVHSEGGKLLPLVIAGDEKTVKEEVERLEGGGLMYPDIDLELLQRIDPHPYQGMLRVSREVEASMIMIPWQDEFQGVEIIPPGLSEILWESPVPVFAGRMTMSADAQKRFVLVVTSQTVGVKLAHEAVRVITSLTKAVDLPLMIYSDSHYQEDLEKLIQDAQAEVEINPIDKDGLDDFLNLLDEFDHLIFTSMGSRERFFAEEVTNPRKLIEKFTGSISLFHYP
jgi:hypothetical protein